MSISPRKKKFIVRTLMILATLIVVIIGVLYYIIAHKFKESIQFIVNKETKGRYEFNADKAKISFINKTVTLSNASLHCVDTLNIDKHYDVKLPQVYFSISSWKNLIFDKKLMIDSLSIKEPDINIHIHKDAPASVEETAAFQTVDILNFLEKSLTHFNAHAFSIKDLSFTYSKLNGPPPLHGDHISINIVNFTKVDDNDNHILGSDSITLSLGRQKMGIPGWQS